MDNKIEWITKGLALLTIVGSLASCGGGGSSVVGVNNPTISARYAFVVD